MAWVGYNEGAPLLSHRHAAVADNVKQQESRSMSRVGVWAIFCINLIPGMASLMFLPFINQMLLENRIAKDPKEVGYYSGYLESLFAIVQLFTIIPVSYAATIVGRKPVILFGTMGLALSSVCFGVSKTYFGMLLSRALGGVIIGTGAAMRVMLSEMVPRAHQATAFGGFSVSYQIGQIIGLPLGGYLAHPERYIGLAAPFWKEYPFALPCFVCATFAVLVSAYGYLTLHENPWTPFSSQPATSENHVSSAIPKPPKPTEHLNALTETTLHQLLGCFITCLFGGISFPLLSLWAFTPLEAGGLQMQENAIGMLLIARSTTQIIGFGLMPMLERWLGPELLYKLTSSAWLMIFPLFPVANLYARSYGDSGHPFVVATLLAICILWTFTSMTLACLTIMINAAATSPDSRTQVHALLQFTSVVPQALGPILGASLFAFSAQTALLNGNLVWVVLFLVACAFTVHAWIFVRRKEHHDVLDLDVLEFSVDRHAECAEC